MTISIVLQFVVVLAAIWMGARYSGVGLGLWGAVGLLVLVVAFGVNPTSPPIDVMLIILAVIMAASVMDAAGGIDFLVRIAERIIRANPKYVTIVAPLTTWTFTFLAGTGHIVYPLLPVIYETGKSLHEIVVNERKLLTQEKWDEVFSFENLISPKFEQ